MLSDGDLSVPCLPERGPMGKAHPLDIFLSVPVRKDPLERLCRKAFDSQNRSNVESESSDK